MSAQEPGECIQTLELLREHIKGLMAQTKGLVKRAVEVLAVEGVDPTVVEGRFATCMSCCMFIIQVL